MWTDESNHLKLREVGSWQTLAHEALQGLEFGVLVAFSALCDLGLG